MAGNSQPNTPNLEGNGDGKNVPDPKLEGKDGGNGGSDGKQPKGTPDVNYDKLAKENENLRGTVSALTKKLNSFDEGFKKMFGGAVENKDDLSDPLKAYQALNNQFGELKNELQSYKAKDLTNEIIDNLKDAEGNDVDVKIKSYLRKKITVNTVDPEAITTAVNAELNSLKDLIGGTNFTSDKRPEVNKPVGGNSKTPTNANEILDSIKAK